MVEGLEVTIRYKGPKLAQVASTTLSHNAEIAILKKDLGQLRVHVPSQKNVRRVDGAFILHWPTASTTSETNVTDSLYTRWMKLAGDDPDSRSLRETLSIASITLTQDGRPIGSNAGEQQHGEGPPPTTSPVIANDNQNAETSTTAPQPQTIAALSKPLPTEPRKDRERLPKRPLSSGERSPSPIRQKLDEEALQKQQTSTVVPQSVNTSLQTRSDRSATPRDPASGAPSPSTAGASAINLRIPETIVFAAQHEADPGSSKIPQAPKALSAEQSKPSVIPPPRVPRGPKSVSPHPSVVSSGGGRSSTPHTADRENVNRLTRELWDVRREMNALQAREKAISQQLGRLGARLDTPSSERSSQSRDDIESRLARAEEELRKERLRRLRAERALEDVERECKAPFVVPALFQAFMTISELSS